MDHIEINKKINELIDLYYFNNKKLPFIPGVSNIPVSGTNQGPALPGAA
jgi:hypothetical protein